MKLFVLLWLLTSVQIVSISIRPGAVMAGGAIRVTCSVPRHADNRWLVIGVEGTRQSGSQIDGENGPSIKDLLVEGIPCDAGPAYCEVTRNNGKTYRAERAIVVAGCDPPAPERSPQPAQ